MRVKIRCCNETPIFEIDYEIGTKYLVCSICSKKNYFVRGIKSKREIGSQID